MIMDPETQVNGVVIIEDMSGFSLKKMISISRKDKAQLNAGFELIQVVEKKKKKNSLSFLSSFIHIVV